MTRKRACGHLVSVTALLSIVSALVLACSPARDGERPAGPETQQASVSPADAWTAALQTTPFPYKLPLPEPAPTILDGTYAKVEVSEAEPVHCLRCPDYAPEGGVWKLHLDRGIFRLFHQASGWNSAGSFVLSKDEGTSGATDQLVLFNDPACPGYVGVYAWRVEEGALILEVVADTCSIHMRALNLANLPWLSCRSPNAEAGITGHWQKPDGCE